MHNAIHIATVIIILIMTVTDTLNMKYINNFIFFAFFLKKIREKTEKSNLKYQARRIIIIKQFLLNKCALTESQMLVTAHIDDNINRDSFLSVCLYIYEKQRGFCSHTTQFIKAIYKYISNTSNISSVILWRVHISFYYLLQLPPHHILADTSSPSQNSHSTYIFTAYLAH